MSKKIGSHHVVPNPDGGWDVKKGGAERSSGHFDHKADAEKVGRKIVKIRVQNFLFMARMEKFKKETAMGTIHIPQKDKDSFL